jgi:pyridoxine 5-phosphate synthase
LKNAANSIDPFIKAANRANELGLGLNAGHDLNLENLSFFAAKIPNLKEVSIGHALIADALNYGMENAVNLYLRALKT